MASFEELLSKTSDQIEKPKGLPAGTYKGILASFSGGESAPYGEEKKFPSLRFKLMLTEATEDVDPELLEGIDLGKASKNLRDYEMYLDLPNEKPRQYLIYKMIESFGIDTTGKSLKELLPEILHKDALIVLTMSDKDGVVYNNIRQIRGA